MRIVIDLQGAQGDGSRKRGIGRYTLSLAKAMAHCRGTHDIIIALNGLFENTLPDIHKEFDGILPANNIQVWNAVGPLNRFKPQNAWRWNAAALTREAFLHSLSPHMVHLASPFEGFGDDAVHSIGSLCTLPTVATIYDLIPLLNPEQYLDTSPRYKAFYYEKLEHLKHANGWLAISESSRREAIKHLALPSDDVINISAAADPIFRPVTIPADAQLSLRQRYRIIKPFVMYTSATDPRKNHLRLIRAFSLLPAALRHAYQLVFAGELPKKQEQKFYAYAKECGLSTHELIITGWISDDELLNLYNLCTLFVFPSWHEGFGLPALEAMSCGAPVIAANTSSVPEVVANADALFDPLDENSIALKMEEVLRDPSLQRNLSENGKQQAATFSWNRCAQKAITAMEHWHRLALNPTPKYSVPKYSGDIVPELIKKVAVIPHSSTPLERMQLAEAIVKNHRIVTKKQLLIDISIFYQRDAGTGIQRVVRETLRELIASPPDGFVIRTIAAGRRHWYRHVALNNEPVPYENIDIAPDDVFLGLDLSAYAVSTYAKQLAHWQRSGALLYFMVYDLLPAQYPQWFTPKASTLYTRWLQSVISLADGVFCISHTVANDFSQWQQRQTLDTNKKKPYVHTVPMGWNGVPHVFDNPHNHNSPLLATLPQTSTMALMVGTLEPRKGHAQIIEAFEEAWRQSENYTLVIVGRPGWNTESLQLHIRSHPHFNHRLFWFDHADDKVLHHLYTRCNGVIAASYAEGFGLPLIEALGYDKPVLARDIPIFREHALPGITYFTATDGKALYPVLKQWIEQITHAPQQWDGQIPLHSWKDTALAIKNAITGHIKAREYLPNVIDR